MRMGSASMLHGSPHFRSTCSGSTSSSRCPAQATTVYPLPLMGNGVVSDTFRPHMARAMSRPSIGFSAITNLYPISISPSCVPKIGCCHCHFCPHPWLVSLLLIRRGHHLGAGAAGRYLTMHHFDRPFLVVHSRDGNRRSPFPNRNAPWEAPPPASALRGRSPARSRRRSRSAPWGGT